MFSVVSKLVYVLWCGASVAFIRRMDCYLQREAVLYFCASVAVLGLVNLFASRRMLKAAERFEPDNYENLKLYLTNTKQHKALLRSDVPEVQRCIRDYVSLRPFAGILVILVIVVELYLIVKF